MYLLSDFCVLPMTNWTACTIFCMPLFTMSKESSHNSGGFILAHSFSATFVFTHDEQLSLYFACHFLPCLTVFGPQNIEKSVTLLCSFLLFNQNIEKYK